MMVWRVRNTGTDLIVTSGSGLVTTEHEQREINGSSAPRTGCKPRSDRSTPGRAHGPPSASCSSGRAPARRAFSRRRPNFKVLYTTGYTRNAVVHSGVLDPGVELIGKPFTIEELAARVRNLLDAPNAPSSGQAFGTACSTWDRVLRDADRLQDLHPRPVGCEIRPFARC
jgi:hypothetical protein